MYFIFLVAGIEKALSIVIVLCYLHGIIYFSHEGNFFILENTECPKTFEA
jgi:hypothetical protein